MPAEIGQLRPPAQSREQALARLVERLAGHAQPEPGNLARGPRGDLQGQVGSLPAHDRPQTQDLRAAGGRAGGEAGQIDPGINGPNSVRQPAVGVEVLGHGSRGAHHPRRAAARRPEPSGPRPARRGGSRCARRPARAGAEGDATRRSSPAGRACSSRRPPPVAARASPGAAREPGRRSFAAPRSGLPDRAGTRAIACSARSPGAPPRGPPGRAAPRGRPRRPSPARLRNRAADAPRRRTALSSSRTAPSARARHRPARN